MRTLDTLCLKEITKKPDEDFSKLRVPVAMNISEMRTSVAKFRTLTIIKTKQFNSKDTYKIYSCFNCQRNKNDVPTSVT
jgi:hypothetical protein